MTRMQDPGERQGPESTPERIAKNEAIAAQYDDEPSIGDLLSRGHIDQETHDRIIADREIRRPRRPFDDLIASLRAERERMGLSLSDIADGSKMDRAAIHKLEIGLNKNPTVMTLIRYATALGKRLDWVIADISAPKVRPRKRRSGA